MTKVLSFNLGQFYPKNVKVSSNIACLTVRLCTFISPVLDLPWVSLSNLRVCLTLS